MDNQNQVTIVKEQPKKIVAFAQKSARQLVDLVSQNNWAINIQGNNYLKFEAWQTVGYFFGYTVKTKSTEYVEYGEVKGFNATVEVLDRSGQIIGGAESVCMSDERNWAGKPLYALKSMAQTRASGRALRQILAWVVVLAGFKPTPAEEMSQDLLKVDYSKVPAPRPYEKTYNLICSMCGIDISSKVAAWSMDKYKAELCYDCQKKADNPTPEDTETMLAFKPEEFQTNGRR